jgi:hypothetical protein
VLTYFNPLFNLECLKGGCELPWYEAGISAERHFMHREKFRSLSPEKAGYLSPHMQHLSVAERGDNPQIKNNKN